MKKRKRKPRISRKQWRKEWQGVAEVIMPRRARTVDMVNHPPHYTKGRFETIEVIEDIVQFYPAKQVWAAGNVIRYLSRAEHKGNKLEDLKKAQFYMNRLVDQNS